MMKILQDSFLKNNAIFFTGSLVVALLNYLYHPVLARLMSVENFGEVQALLSLYLLLTSFLGILSYLVINITANASQPYLAELVAGFKTFAYYVSAAILVGLLVFLEPLRAFFKFGNYSPLLGLGLLLFLATALTFKNSLLQGMQDFASLSVSNILAAAGKLLFGVALVWLGFEVAGAVAAIVLAHALALVFVTFKTKAFFTRRQPGNAAEISYRSEINYAALIFAVVASAAFFQSADILWVKYYFSPEEAGLYSGVSVVAKIIFFLTLSIGSVMFAGIKAGNTVANSKMLIKSLFAVSAVGGLVALTFLAFPDMVISSLIGGRYLELSGILANLSLFSLLLGVVNVMLLYFLALRKISAGYIAVAGVLAACLLNLARHSSVEQIVSNFIISVCLVAVLLAVVYVKTHFHNNSDL